MDKTKSKNCPECGMKIDEKTNPGRKMADVTPKRINNRKPQVIKAGRKI